MKDMFKSTYDENQISYKNMQESYDLLEGMFKYNMDLYKKLLQNSTNYWEHYTKKLGETINMYNQSRRSEKSKEGTFPANGHEIYNYVARYSVSNCQIQAILRFDERLDFDRLKRAVRLSVEAEPILKCHFVEDNPPYWRPIENINIINYCYMEETDDTNQAIDVFLQSLMELNNGPMVILKLIRNEKYNDALVLKVNHAWADGAGTQEYIKLLADIYSNIDQENGSFIMEPRIAGRKDQDRLFAELGITDPNALFIQGSDIALPMWPFPWEKGSSNTACISFCRLHHGQLDVISRYAKSRGFTVNDLILTSYYRALLEMGQPIYGLPMEVLSTVDLRRYLPDHKTQAIRNFSGSVSTRLSMSLNEPFAQTLQRVAAIMREVKKNYPGLQSAIGLERVEKLNFHDTLAYYQASPELKNAAFCPLYNGDRCVPTLSNLGYLSNSLIKFGSSTVIDALIVPPVVRAPGILLMACSYNSVLTLALGYYKYTVSRENIEKLLNKMRDELILECRNR